MHWIEDPWQGTTIQSVCRYFIFIIVGVVYPGISFQPAVGHKRRAAWRCARWWEAWKLCEVKKTHSISDHLDRLFSTINSQYLMAWPSWWERICNAGMSALFWFVFESVAENSLRVRWSLLDESESMSQGTPAQLKRFEGTTLLMYNTNFSLVFSFCVCSRCCDFFILFWCRTSRSGRWQNRWAMMFTTTWFFLWCVDTTTHSHTIHLVSNSFSP